MSKALQILFHLMLVLFFIGFVRLVLASFGLPIDFEYTLVCIGLGLLGAAFSGAVHCAIEEEYKE